ncbi:Rieske 2Fe-2S domain-containing protein [Bordetella pseudohinzii]|uniref:3-ketosteroid-9-alpha-hydroxylase oxygenase subunit n=2 Tax=Bordetella pseudohinzii TaxID=1331258 RepID=A0A0J6BWK4_9BORD|nr:Rieske 2Fe-2S domain-containing protein [Bordetella pseudohinzii]ANY15083.1 iron-sulfur containing oxygenase [Bordetella pseudohinzii]KMM26124.1 iron-sulfur containing oxygenase [Bordetella pseudohinzii]KXA82853.1 iron-sulfur containing oxygenase [Bordetella pseudohinzii]CUI52846.1 3-ketosteroid-9-alpha-hydroxylase oxygenase subunit [Bordetella pseudohinzii]
MSAIDERRQERARQFQRLTQCDRDTDMGKLLRRFWQPIELSENIEVNAAIPVKVLGEALTLYRGASGALHLVGGRCAHRRTLLHTGWVVGEEIRCIYHGWQFDSSGACVKRPAEADTGMPRTQIAAYPVREYQGLVFAYLGEGDAPAFDLPRKLQTEREGALVANGMERWDNNWFQQVENSMDAVHVSFVHMALTVGPFGKAVTAGIPELSYEETAAGIRQTARRSEGNVRQSDWTFPNNNHITVPGLTPDDPWLDVFVWMLPNDELNTTRFMIYSLPPGASEASKQRFRSYFAKYGKYDPAAHHEELFRSRVWKNPEDTFVGLTAAQDYLSIRGQERVTHREDEILGRSDLGIVTLRKIFWRELDLLRDGKQTKAWKALEKPVDLPLQPGEEGGAGQPDTPSAYAQA